ncbi:DUF397 domain-containing protein [Nocardia sp. NPDC059180]|uniref:DUF397 domain-containing protein n=1 Tax=Nocardia sp. NPDC059180 TaxID=3346761 RepID=UPI0036BE1437
MRVDLSTANWFKSSHSSGGQECVEVAHLDQAWFKSSHSSASQDCVEVAHVDQSWFKSSHSGGGQECVEVAHLDQTLVGVRDSKNPTGPALLFTPVAWDAFLVAVDHGRFGPSAQG